MRRCDLTNSNVAKERLRLMFESSPLDHDYCSASRMKEEIFDLLSRYYDFSHEDYDIKILIRPKKRV